MAFVFPATPLPRKIGDYVVVRRLRNEGPVEVLLAKEEGPLGFSREVALKCVKRDPATAGAATELAREARVCSRLVSPAIARVLGLFEDTERVVLVLEHVEGATLSGVLAHLEAQGGKLDDGAAAYIGATVATALAFAHALTDETGAPTPVLHRAVSPNAVLVARDGTVKLTGFGLAKILDRTPDSVVGMVKGAAGYLAPEQARGETVTEKADVFSAGMLCHRLLAGPGKQGGGGIVQLVAGRPAQLASLREGLPKELCAAVDAALSEDAKKRTISCAELARWIGKVQKLEEGKAALREIVAAMPQEGEDPAPRPDRPSRRRQRLTGKRSVLGMKALRASRPGLELDLEELDDDEEDEEEEQEMPGPRISTNMGIGPASVPPAPAAAPAASASVAPMPVTKAPTPPPKGGKTPLMPGVAPAAPKPSPRPTLPSAAKTPLMPGVIPVGKALTPMPPRAKSEPPRPPHLPAPPPHPPHGAPHIGPDHQPGRLRTPVPLPTADGMVAHDHPAPSEAPKTEDVTESDLLRSVPPRAEVDAPIEIDLGPIVPVAATPAPPEAAPTPSVPPVGPKSVRPIPIPDTAKFLTPAPAGLPKAPMKTLLGMTPPPPPAEPLALALTPPPVPHPAVPDEPKVIPPPEAEPVVPVVTSEEPPRREFVRFEESLETQRSPDRRRTGLYVLGGVGLVALVLVVVALASGGKPKPDERKSDDSTAASETPKKKKPAPDPSTSTSTSASVSTKPALAEPSGKPKSGNGFLRVHTEKVGKVFVSGNPTGDPEAVLEAPCGRKFINLARLDEKGKWKAWLSKGTLATVTCDGKVTDVTLP